MYCGYNDETSSSPVTRHRTVSYSLLYLFGFQGGEKDLKRTITSIAAASMALGMLVPVAFASSSTTSLKKASQLPIVVNGAVLSNPFEMTGMDSGNTTGFFPIYYFNQALAKVGFTATWDGVNHVWAITAPAGTTVAPVAGGVGTGNTSVTVNGTVVKKFNTQAAKDPAGSTVTTYLPIFYINNVLSALGVKGTFSGQTGLSVTVAATPVTGQGSISAPAISGENVGTGTQAAPAVSYSAPIKVASTVTDANGNAISGVNATLDIVAGAGGAPTVTVNGTSVAPTSSSSNEFQYAITTDSTGTASAQISVNSNTSAYYTVRYFAPFNMSGSNVVVKSSKVYVAFVAPNTLGIAPGPGVKEAVSTSANSDAGLTPVTVIVPPSSETPQQGVAVTFTIATTSTPATPNATGFFATMNGGSLGTGSQTVYTNADGEATVFVDSTSEGTAYVTATTSQYGNTGTSIAYSQAGVVSQVANLAATGYQQEGSVANAQSTASNSKNYQANLGNNVTFQGTAQDQSGNAVANAQLLVVNSELNSSTASPAYGPSNSSHGNYVDGTTTTGFPNVNVTSLDGNTNPSTLGEVVTTDASGNFNFTVNDNETNNDQYLVYAIQGGTVAGDALWAPIVSWQTSTTLVGIGVGGVGAKLTYNTNSVTGLVATAQPSFTSINPVTQLPNIRFDGFAGKNAPISVGLNETYNVSASGEADGSIYGVQVDHPNSSLSADFNGNYYMLNAGSRGEGSATIRVEAMGNDQYEIFVNGTDIGYNVQSTYGNTSDTNYSPAITTDGQYAGTVQFAGADDDNGSVTYTISALNQKATAGVTFNGGAPAMAESFSPSEVSLTNGQSQDLSFTLEDANGNAVANTLGKVSFADPANLWVTKINGVALTSNETGGINGTGSSSEPTPIPLFDFSSLYGGFGVNVAGVGSWSPSNATGSQTVTAYSDANGKITLTLQDGSVSFWNGTQVVTAPSGGTGSSILAVYSPVNSGTPSSDYAVYVGPNPGSWTQEGQINW
jgi:hypothetical protein